MKTVLIIEDDYFIRDLYKRTFARAGYEVSVAEDGQQGVDILKEQQFDIVLLDIMMPKLTGIDVLKRVRDPSFPAKDVPIFLITNLGQNDIIEEAFKIGADGYFLKSQMTPETVITELEKLFAKRQGISK